MANSKQSINHDMLEALSEILNDLYPDTLEVLEDTEEKDVVIYLASCNSGDQKNPDASFMTIVGNDENIVNTLGHLMLKNPALESLIKQACYRVDRHKEYERIRSQIIKAIKNQMKK